MTPYKITRDRCCAQIICLLLFLSTLGTNTLAAQENVGLRLSVAAAAGYAPVVTHGSRDNAGVVVGLYGELEYGPLIGRLQFTKPMLGLFAEDENLEGGVAYHGALGYRLDLAEKIALGLLLSGGAMVVRYNNGFNGSSGDQFTNVSPQAGLIVAPTYQISKLLSVQGNLRYYKGFEAGDRGRASDLADVSVALRISLGK